MKTLKLSLLLAVLPALWGCASFNSGDVRVERDTARAMLEDKALVPFSKIQISWQNFPYRAPTASIGEGSTRPVKLKPLPVERDDAADFGRRARDIFAKAGLYDKARGRGTLRLELTSFGRWTYSDLFRSYLVDTGFIFILPSSLRVNYHLAADFAVASGAVLVETEARHKTVFHLLMAPLYPFFSPGVRENGLLNQMLWRSATDVYSKLKAAGAAPRELPPKAVEPETRTQSISVPPLEPDRSWLPGQPVEGAASPEAAPITPEKPDQTWVVPSGQQQAPAEQKAAALPAPGAAPITPEEPDKTWVVPSGQPPAPATPAPTPAKEPPAADETPDD